jgi:hypothetical protein
MTEKWITVQLVMPTRFARQIVEGKFEPLTDLAFVAPGGGPIPDTVTLRAGQAVVQLDVMDNPDQKVTVTGQTQSGQKTAPVSFRVLSAVAVSRARNARIIRATP